MADSMRRLLARALSFHRVEIALVVSAVVTLPEGEPGALAAPEETASNADRYPLGANR